jgi:hypothetical protein
MLVLVLVLVLVVLVVVVFMRPERVIPLALTEVVRASDTGKAEASLVGMRALGHPAALLWPSHVVFFGVF